MSDEGMTKLEGSLRRLQKRVNESDSINEAGLRGLRHAVLAYVAAGLLLALTATTWRTTWYKDDVVDVSSLWGLVPKGWQAGLTLVLVLVVALGTVVVFLLGEARPGTHHTYAALAFLMTGPILLLGGLEGGSWSRFAVEQPGAGRWLTLVAALLLALVHLVRANEVKQR